MSRGAFFVGAIVAGLLLSAGLGAQSRYTFPISGDRSILTWEEPHWDGSNAVDIGIHSGFSLDAAERTRFYAADVRAVIAGRASRLDNPRGGVAVLLHGEDGRTYYYAHLSQAYIDGPTSVEAGASLGRIGRTGTWTQYLEPHLHFSIAEGHQVGTEWTADVPAASWLRRTFGIGPVRRNPDAYVAREPSGLPLFGEPEVVRTFRETRAENPLLAGVVVRAPGAGTRGPAVPVRAPVTGIARVHLDTPLGVRLQITNSRSSRSLIISGTIEPQVRTGELVYADSIVGFARGELHYMDFSAGIPIDPLGPDPAAVDR